MSVRTRSPFPTSCAAARRGRRRCRAVPRARCPPARAPGAHAARGAHGRGLGENVRRRPRPRARHGESKISPGCARANGASDTSMAPERGRSASARTRAATDHIELVLRLLGRSTRRRPATRCPTSAAGSTESNSAAGRRRRGSRRRSPAATSARPRPDGEVVLIPLGTREPTDRAAQASGVLSSDLLRFEAPAR